MTRPAHRIDLATREPEVSYLCQRVRLFLQVMLVIDVIAYASDYVTPLFVEGLSAPDYASAPTIMRLRWALTAGVVAGWAYTRFSRPGRTALIALESGVTIGLVLMYVHLASIHMSDDLSSYAPLFTMFGIMLLLSVRASLVPSPVLRTVLIGLGSVASLFMFSSETIGALEPRVLDGLTFIGGAFVVATGVTSHVIYGLRREVSEAKQLGQYTLEEKLGEGGMGAVYRARHAMLRREAAIKLIKPPNSDDGARKDEVTRRFEREADVTANLKSPHTIQLYDFGMSAEGDFYYVMELLDGIDLETVVAKYGPMESSRVVFLLRQVCDSLQEAHEAGLVHRDIKPANILLCHQGIHYDFVKVLDFGLVALAAQKGSVDQKLTADGSFGGTPAYVAPEMVAGRESVDGRADVYALGCVAYWLLTGHAPFERETAMATILAHVNETPPPPSTLSELAVPAELDQLVLDCLAKLPEDRPPSAADLSRRLDAVPVGEPWNQEEAKRWWNRHEPARLSAVADESPLRITKVLR